MQELTTSESRSFLFPCASAELLARRLSRRTAARVTT
jgi:hypothetical protein